MSDLVIGLVIGSAVLVAAFLLGKQNAKLSKEIDEARKANEENKESLKVRKRTATKSDAAIREWLRTNSKK